MAITQRARPVALIVLDGWGYRPETDGNAIALAKTPTWDALWGRGSRTLLEASGLRVGLPAGQMGNSEVGHLNLGAGRVVMQDLVRISSAIADGSFYTNPALTGACRQVTKLPGTLHLMGLIGSGGVHAIDTHLSALLDFASSQCAFFFTSSISPAAKGSSGSPYTPSSTGATLCPSQRSDT